MHQNNDTIPFHKFDDAQKAMVHKLIMTLKNWMERSNCCFPLCVPIRGIAGSGKSTVIKFRWNAIFDMFHDSEWQYINRPFSEDFRLLESTLGYYVRKHRFFKRYFTELQQKTHNI